MLKKILLFFLLVVAVLVVVIAMQPSEFRIERSTTIAAPPADVFAQVNDFHNWQAWNPWGKIDPAMKETFEGPASGVGAGYSWTGNDDVGEGKMTIAESKPNDLIRVDLHFIKPMEGTSVAEFTFKPQGDGTQVTWSMAGHKNFMSKAFCLFVNMDKMIGDEFEKGLADMKTATEANQKK